MRVRRTPRGGLRAIGSLSLTVVALGSLTMPAACGGSAPAASKVTDCGPSRTAANVPVEVEVKDGSVACGEAMTIEKSYAKAIVAGHVPGNGGGAPIAISGWTCQGFSTPEVLKTGNASRCARKGTEILEVLKT